MNVLEQYDDGKRYNSNGNWWYVDKECKHEGCHTLIDSCDNEYTYHGGKKARQQIIWCNEHYHSLSRGRNDRTNAISAAAYEKAGSSAKFYKLPDAVKKAFRAEATIKYDGGNVIQMPGKVKSQETYEPLNTRSPNTNKTVSVDEGTLYVNLLLLGVDVYKVGSTYIGRLEKRLSELQTSVPMRCVCTMDITSMIAKDFEAEVHVVLRQYNLRNDPKFADYVGEELVRCDLTVVLDAIKTVALRHNITMELNYVNR